MAVIRVVVADDQPLLLNGIVDALEKAEDIDVAAAEESPERVPALVDRLAPDVVLLGVRGSPHAAFACLDELHGRRGSRLAVLGAIRVRRPVENEHRRPGA